MSARPSADRWLANVPKNRLSFFKSVSAMARHKKAVSRNLGCRSPWIIRKLVVVSGRQVRGSSRKVSGKWCSAGSISGSTMSSVTGDQMRPRTLVLPVSASHARIAAKTRSQPTPVRASTALCVTGWPARSRLSIAKRRKRVCTMRASGEARIWTANERYRAVHA